MAKKILAVVLAVMMALSAMAITAFAEDAKIPMYALTRRADGSVIYDNNGVVLGDVSNYTNVEVSFDIPLYAMYGYLTQGSKIQLTLPRYFGNNIPEYADSYAYNADHSVAKSPLSVVDWSIIVNGRAYSLEETTLFHDPWWGNPHDVANTDRVADGVNYGRSTSQHTVTVGAFAHDWNKVTNDTQIPQSMGFGDTTTIRLVAAITLDGSYVDWMVSTDDFTQTNPANGRLAYDCKADFYDAQGNLVGTSFMQDWNATKTTVGNDSSNNTYTFVTSDWTMLWDSTSNYNGTWKTPLSGHPITWDHTLANKAAIYGSTSDTVKMVVELNNPIIGQATYTLYSSYEAPTSVVNGTVVGSNSAWWTYNGGRKYIAECKVDGSVDQLEFDVPLSALYDSQGYGSYNQEFVIFENITLWNQSIMNNYLEYNTSMMPQYNGSWKLGRLGNNGSGKVTYDGQQVRYAAGGVTSIADYGTEEVTPATPAVEDKTVKVQVKKVAYKEDYDASVLDADKVFDIEVDANGNAVIDTVTENADGTLNVTYKYKTTRAKAPYELQAQYIDGWKYKLDENGEKILVGYTITGEPVYETEVDAGSTPETVDFVIKGSAATEAETKVIENIHYAGAPTGYNNQTVKGNMIPAKAKSIYLLVPQGEATDVKNPQQGTENEEESENVDDGDAPEVDAEEDTETTEPEAQAPAAEENNPTTGIALAVLPMIVSAAAAVISKKH